MGAKGCGKSGSTVWHALLITTDFFFEAVLSCLEVLVVFAFYASRQIGGGLFERGLVVRYSSCLFLIVERGLVGAFAFFVGLPALDPLIYSTIRITSFHLFIYVFFILHLFVWFFGEVCSSSLSPCGFWFVGCLE